MRTHEFVQSNECELDDLRRELAEARAVLADFLAERRPADSWVMALVGAGFAHDARIINNRHRREVHDALGCHRVQ